MSDWPPAWTYPVGHEPPPHEHRWSLVQKTVPGVSGLFVIRYVCDSCQAERGLFQDEDGRD